MTLPFRTESEAAEELEEAAAWYEQRRPGLGDEFLEAIDEALVFIANWPRTGRPFPAVPPDLLIREAGDSLDEFLDQFPSVSREQAVAALKLAKEAAGVADTH